MATDDIKLVLGAVDNVTNVIAAVEKRVQKIGETTSKFDLLAGLGRAGAAANLLGDGLSFSADVMKALRSDSENMAGDLYAAIEKLPMGFGKVATAAKHLVGEITGINREMEAHNALIAEADSIMATRLASLDFRKNIEEELKLRRALAAETDPYEQSILRMRAAEKKQLDEINAKIAERNNLPDADRERLKNLALEVQATTQAEINRLLEDRNAKERTALAGLNEEQEKRIQKQLDDAQRYNDTLAMLDSEINEMRLRAIGDNEAAEREAIQRRYQFQIDEAMRANEDEKAARLATLMELEIAAAKNRNAPGKARIDTLPELRAIENRLGRSSGSDPVARAAQQSAQKLDNIAAGMQDLVQIQAQLLQLERSHEYVTLTL